jgi:hypothetical protein
MFTTKQEKWVFGLIGAWSLWALFWGSGWEPAIGGAFLAVTGLNMVLYRKR